MGEDRLEEIAAVVDALVAGESAKTLTVEGDGALARIAGGLNALTKRRLGGPEDQALFARGPVVVFRWRNAEGWPVEFVSENVEALTGHPVEEFRSAAGRSGKTVALRIQRGDAQIYVPIRIG